MASAAVISPKAAELPHLLNGCGTHATNGDIKPSEQKRASSAGEAQGEQQHHAENFPPGAKHAAKDHQAVVAKMSTPAAPTSWTEIVGRSLMFLACLYFFLVGLTLMGDAFKVLGGKGASQLFVAIDNPVAGLTVGILVTVMVQSSSTCTSIVVGLVGAGQLSVEAAIPVVMGANIGTSVTNTLVSMGQSGDRDDLERAFAAATVHDMFNLVSVAVLFPLEIIIQAISGVGGPIFYLTDAMTDGLLGEPKGDSGHGSSPVSVITKPLTSLIIETNKYVIKSLSYGAPKSAADGEGGACLSHSMEKAWKKVNEEAFEALAKCTAQGQAACESLISQTTCYLGADEFYTHEIAEAEVISGGVCEHFGETGGGTVALIVSLALLIGALFFLVKALHSLMMGSARHCIMKAVNMHDILAIIVGAIVTMIVQSSSVVTSALTPLAGVGALELRKMLPLTLGANIGTCVTGILAAVAVMQRDAIQISLCHLIFNVFGILIWFPAPPMRRVPLGAAELLGLYASFYRYVPGLYIAVAFLLVPGVALAVSMLLVASFPAGIVSMVAILLAVLSFIYWWVVREGCYQVLSKENRENRWKHNRKRDLAEETTWTRTYSEVPLPEAGEAAAATAEEAKASEFAVSV
eukprot:TRINITY_DN5163_c1_g1_i1.p1 TRINITY_DN5163_c1_g1~~TRINITY_DN5163_c1_g1_i1.p1  ORF type:complete len:635 (+),score=143.34 TRINITY_DN5163_c1_g1_i1:73-1977(+)